MTNFSSRRITRIGLVAALYVVLTLVFAPLSYGSVQFRFSEALMLLCFYHKDHIAALSLGCFISNLFSTVGTIDLVVGTAATLIAAVLIYIFRKEGSITRMVLCSLFPVISNAILVGAEITLMSDEPVSFFICAGSVALGEVVCVSVIGTILFRTFEHNGQLIRMIKEDL